MARCCPFGLGGRGRLQYGWKSAARPSSSPERWASQIVGDHPLAEHWAKVWSERGVPFGAPVDCLTQRDDVTARLPEISVPALVIAGEHDHSIPIARQEQVRQHLTKATEVNIIAGAGHSPTATHPAQVNAVIEQFLVEAKPLGPEFDQTR